MNTRVVLCLLAVTLAGAGGARSAGVEVESGMAEVREPRLYYETAGNGEAVVLIHGGGLDSRMWDGQFEPLSRSYRVVRYDVRGFGRSELPDKPYSDHGDLAQVLDFLKIERAHVVGLSMGGRIAVDFALSYPERVRSLVLAGPGLSGFQFSPESTKRFFDQVRAAQKGEWEKALRTWLTTDYMVPAMEQSSLRPWIEKMARDNLKTLLMNYMLQIDLEPPAVGRLSEIRAPTLLILGDRDVPDIFTIAKLLQEKVPGIRRRDIQGAGHMVNLEKPAEFNKALFEFLDGLPRDR
jgi:3-oxoadipate enol-lactonase